MSLNREQLGRLHDLLADRATGDLQPEGQEEFGNLVRFQPRASDDESFEMAAAAIDEAFATARPEAMPALPAELRARLLASGRASLGAENVTDFHASRESLHPSTESEVRSGGGSIVPWLIAAAAALLAVVGWWQAGRETLPVEPAAPTVAELREDLLRTAPDLVQLSWTATEDEAAVGADGDVVWSSSENTGYMRIAGLQVNDPAEFQYQLWIFDELRDERYPVDGGVFDISAETVSSDGSVIVPIRAKLPVDRAVLFAITVEQPGGVVVSDRERIVLLAQAT